MNKSYGLIKLVILVITILSAASQTVGASDWQQIGYGTLDGVRFDVYVDPKTVLRVGDKVRFWQGHVFYIDQTLPSGSRYMRVSIEREGDCAQNTGRNLQAIFYGRDGSMVYNHTLDDSHKQSSPDSIDIKAVQLACYFSKSNTQGISR